MPKTSQLDVIMQQLNALSVEELLEVRAKVDVLIEGQSPPLAKILSLGRYDIGSFVGHQTQNQCIEIEIIDSLEKVIELVDEWMMDESGYDEETYPQIEVALKQHQPSL